MIEKQIKDIKVGQQFLLDGKLFLKTDFNNFGMMRVVWAVEVYTGSSKPFYPEQIIKVEAHSQPEGG